MRSSRRAHGKILSRASLPSFLEDQKRSLDKIVFTNGCFDVLHVGHTRYLSEARALGDVLVIGLNSDLSVRKLKGPGRPVNTEKARAEVLAALECVDYIVPFSEDTPLDLIKRIRPHYLVKGGDWRKENIVGAQIVESYGGHVRTIPFVKGFSTTRTLDKIKKL